MANITFDTQEVLSDVVEGVKGIMSDQQPKLKSFIRSQTRGAVEFGALIVEGLEKDEITVSQRAVYLEQLEDMITAAAYTVAGAVLAIVEAVWNKMVNIIWTAINTALTAAIDIALPLPDFGNDN
ncbi:MAG: hypothetical protein V7782_11045 [Psychromonas sp.]